MASVSQYLNVFTVVSLCRRYKLNGAVSMLIVVPVYEALNPASRRLHISKGFIRVVRSIFQCAKCGFGIPVIAIVIKTSASFGNIIFTNRKYVPSSIHYRRANLPRQTSRTCGSCIGIIQPLLIFLRVISPLLPMCCRQLYTPLQKRGYSPLTP